MSGKPKSVRGIGAVTTAFTPGFDSDRADFFALVKTPITTGEGAAF
jgi:hypothetical protein